MAGRKSWAEARWWRGAKTDPLLAVIFVVAIVFGFPMFMMWRVVSQPLQRYYISAYRASCETSPPGSRTTNSSPPNLPTESYARTCPEIVAATARSTVSPARFSLGKAHLHSILHRGRR